MQAPEKTTVPMKRKLLAMFLAAELILVFLAGRTFYIQAYEADFLQRKAYEQHTRDRLIRPARGNIYDRNMNAIAVSAQVSSVSVIASQVKDKEETARALSDLLGLDYDATLIKIKRRVALERIKDKVDKKLADEIRALDLPGVVVDEDVTRLYPYSELAAQVIGFVGKDNQGIIGLEAKYDKYLKGAMGKILTQTDARGINIENGTVDRIDPMPGYNLVTSLDITIQQYAEQTIKKITDAKEAERGLIIMMNPQNGEILALANYPSFDLNDPFTINSDAYAAVWDALTQKERTDLLNQMWRDFGINDTYEPGSTFKIVTAAAGLEEGVVSLNSTFVCSGSVAVGGRNIKCWRSPRSHGFETFAEGVQNSCNPVFMEIASRLGKDTFYDYLLKFGFDKKTGVDLPGEAVGIMYKPDKIGPVELATMSFGQSLQITPLQLMRAASAAINGGKLITPHVGVKLTDGSGLTVEEFTYEQGDRVVSEETSAIMRDVLESVVEVGTGNRTYIPGYRVGGKTATSEKLPRGAGKYVSSFLAFSPAENPQVIALLLIDEPQGAHYGGQVAGPPMKELLENVLPYLGIEPVYTEKELAISGVKQVSVPDMVGQTLAAARKTAETLKITIDLIGGGDVVKAQFPPPGELINQGSKILLYMGNKEE